MVEVLAVIIRILKVGLFTISGTICGLAAGTFLRFLVTNLVLIPIFSLLPPSSQDYGYTPLIRAVGGLIILTSAIVGGGVGYFFGCKKAKGE